MSAEAAAEADADADTAGASLVQAPAAAVDDSPPVAVGVSVTKVTGLRWLRAFYDREFWEICDEVLPFFDRSTSIQEIAGQAKTGIGGEVTAHVRQTKAYEAWEAVCEELHGLLVGWILVVMFVTSLVLPLQPIHARGPKGSLVLFALIPIGAVAVLVLEAPLHGGARSVWPHRLVFVATVLAGCMIILLATPVRFSTEAGLFEALLIVLLVVLLWASGARLGSFTLTLTNKRWAIGSYLAVLALASILAALRFPAWPRWVQDGLRIGLWVVVLNNLLLGLALTTDALIRTLISKRKHAKHPISAIVSSLLSTILAVEEGLTRKREAVVEAGLTRKRQVLVPVADSPLQGWQAVDFRREIVVQLEKLAQRYERDLPRRLRTTDITDLWLQARGRALANAVRQWKQDVLMPAADTRDKLLRSLATNLVHIAKGEWARLDCTELPGGSRSLAATVSNAARNIVAAALPLAIVLAVKGGLVDVSAKFVDPLVPYAAAWFAIRILGWLVPEARGQVSGTADAIDGISHRLPGVGP
jgi:hypothetical protein